MKARLTGFFGFGLLSLHDGGFLIGDARNNRVRRVDPEGTIGTVAGGGPDGAGDRIPADQAELLSPQALSAVPGGSYLIAETDRGVIRKVMPDGSIYTVAGDSGPGPAPDRSSEALRLDLFRPRDVAALPDGGFLIADTFNGQVHRVFADGRAKTVAGIHKRYGFSGDGGPATQARLDGPDAVEPLPGGGFLIADRFNHRIRHVDRRGIIRTVAGGGKTRRDGSPSRRVRLSHPSDVRVLADGSYLIAELEPQPRIRLIATGRTNQLAVALRSVDISRERSTAPTHRLRLDYVTSKAALVTVRIKRDRSRGSFRRLGHAPRGRHRTTLTADLRPGRYLVELIVRDDRRMGSSSRTVRVR